MGKGSKKVLFCCVGGGKMGESLIQGLLAAKVFKPAQIQVLEPTPERRKLFEEKYHIRSVQEVPEAEIYLLAVKPQDMAEALGQIKEVMPPSCLVMSIAAGITTDWILERLGNKRKVVRAMPNAAAVVQESATGLYFMPGISARERKLALSIFEAVGTVVVVKKEDLLDKITGLSGSGPGYVFLLLEAFAEAGVTVGLPRETAVQLALQTFVGSAAMARETGTPFPMLKEIITSPGGTTAAGLKVLEEHAVRGAILNAVEAASRRAGELSS